MSGISHAPEDHGEIVRRLVPAATVLAGLLVMALPLPLAWGVMPHIGLLLVLIWSSIQPRLMPAWGAFLLGLFADVLFGGPIAIWGLLFAAAAVIVRLAETRIEGHSLAVDWAFTALLVLAVQLLAWQLLAFLGSSAPLLPFLVQALVTALAYPLVAAVAARIQRRLAVFGD